MYESIVVPGMLYGSETWAMSARDRSRLEVVEMKCLRSICGVTRMDRLRNEYIRNRCDLKNGIGVKVERNVLRWFGHIERMDDERLVKKVYESSVEGGRRRGRPCKRWKDCVKEYVQQRGVEWARAEELVNDRSGWREMWKGNRVAV